MALSLVKVPKSHQQVPQISSGSDPTLRPTSVCSERGSPKSGVMRTSKITHASQNDRIAESCAGQQVQILL